MVFQSLFSCTALNNDNGHARKSPKGPVDLFLAGPLAAHKALARYEGRGRGRGCGRVRGRGRGPRRAQVGVLNEVNVRVNNICCNILLS